MGLPSDAEELMGKALHDVRNKKLARLAWALGTAVVTVVSTTATVSWKMATYVAQLERFNDELRGEIRVLAKDLEKSQVEQKELRDEMKTVRQRADSALLIAQLSKREKQ